MTNATWFLVIGGVLLFMAMTAARIQRLPLSTAIFYLVIGLVLGPSVLNQFHFNPLQHSAMLEVVTEIAVLISLFGAGLKLAAPVGARIWWLPFRLATISMLVTVALTAFVGVLLLDLPIGAAILLGGILAPTDPVLATEVQVKSPGDDNRLRFALTGEAGLNDGTAFPIIMLGLGILGLHDLGDGYQRWILVDVLWACTCGIGVGGVLGAITAWLISYFNESSDANSEFTEDFVGLGLIAVSYGLSLLMLGYGFLAVFAAGFMLHRTGLYLDKNDSKEQSADARLPAVDETVGAVRHMSNASLLLVGQLERIGEVALLLIVGGMIFPDSLQIEFVIFAAILIFVVRPVAVLIGLFGSPGAFVTKAAIGWFGIRGIGSFYYLMYAIQHGLDDVTATRLVSVVIVVVATSILLHGVSVTPLMRLYSNRT